MRNLLLGITAAITAINPAIAQVPPTGPYQPQWAPTPYSDLYNYRFVAPTPSDAYRDRTINRWQYEQLEGPIPPALQGPSPNGGRGGGGGES
jgi:hypothetical protein